MEQFRKGDYVRLLPIMANISKYPPWTAGLEFTITEAQAELLNAELEIQIPHRPLGACPVSAGATDIIIKGREEKVLLRYEGSSDAQLLREAKELEEERKECAKGKTKRHFSGSDSDIDDLERLDKVIDDSECVRDMCKSSGPTIDQLRQEMKSVQPQQSKMPDYGYEDDIYGSETGIEPVIIRTKKGKGERRHIQLERLPSAIEYQRKERW